MSEKPKFSFALPGNAASSNQTPATSGAGGGSLFGSTASTPGGNGGFGSANTGGSLFGGTPAATPPASSGGSGFGFGQPAASGSQAQKPLFGAVGSSSSGAFGGAPATSGDQGKSLFGAAPSSASGFSGFSFGSSKPASPAPGASSTPASQPPAGQSTFGGGSASGLFGAKAPTTGEAGSSLFAPKPQGTPAPAAGQPNKPASSLFGGGTNNTPAANPQSLFSATPSASGSTTPQPAKSGPSLFSTTPAGNPPAATSLFSNLGNKANENQQPAAGSGNGQKSLFATEDKSAAKPSGFTFPTAPPSFKSDGSVKSASTAAAANGQNKAPSLFSATPAAAPPSGTSNIFGNLNKKPEASAGPAPPASGSSGQSLFSAVGQNSGAAASTPSSQPAAAATSAPSFSLFSAQTSSSGTSQPAATTTAGGASGATATFGVNPSTTTGGAGGGSSLFSKPTATPAGAGQTGTAPGGLFGALPAQPAASGAGTSSTTPAFTPAAAPATGAGASLFGGGVSTSGPGAAASTSGPAPPAQSRLAAKTMDEILTMWSTSLASHQKTFQSLASRVGAWDRMLVENSSSISTLYSRCFQAERDCSEVERQLSGVEHAQTELESMLDRYETEVDRLLDNANMGDSGPGVSGVDAERERTYKSAEHCSTRLTEMSHSLTDMIDEINAASSKLSNTGAGAQQNGGPRAAAAEDPLAQIVRVLNGHLAQLQSIDAGAAALQGKVGTAQREARDLQGRGGAEGAGLGRSAWMDDFGRSYLGRR